MTRQNGIFLPGLDLMKDIQFLGLGFEEGQEKKGLHHSHIKARSFFPYLQSQGLRMIDKGQVLSQGASGSKLHSSEQIKAFSWDPYQRAYQKIQTLLQKPEVLLNWGGDHSVAMSTVGAFCAQNPDGHVVWIDAHADMNLPEFSLSGNVHGMPLSILLNLNNIAANHFPWLKSFLKPENLIYVGIRDLDPFEKKMLRDLKITAYSAADIRREGMARIAKNIFEKVQGAPLHISFDIDSLTPEVAPSTGVPVADGLTLSEAKLLASVLSKHSNMTSVDVVEVNPEIGSPVDVFRTYFAAFQFLTSLFNEGVLYDGDHRSVQTIHSASLEPSL